MQRFPVFPVILVAVVSAGVANGGLYFSGEQFADLPSQWRGFLLDQRAIRMIAVPPSKTQTAHPLRQRYQEAADQLRRTSQQRKLTADESADLGALYVRLGEISKAIDVLRGAARDYPQSFRIIANLGTAWQMHGDLEQAAVYLRQAVRLAPGK